MVWVAALPVKTVSAQGWPDVVWMPNGHDLDEAVEQDKSMKGFVAKYFKRVMKQPSGASVHVVYLVPSDKRPRYDYAAAAHGLRWGNLCTEIPSTVMPLLHEYTRMFV
jgi:hypothetical protein